MEDNKKLEEVAEEVEATSEEIADTAAELEETAEELKTEVGEGAASEEIEAKAQEVGADILAAGAALEEEAVKEKAEVEAKLAEEAAEAAEESAEAAAETAAEMEEVAEELKTELGEGAASEDVAANAQEVGADILAAGAAAEEAELKDKEEVEAKLAEEAEKTKGSAVKEPPIIKKKKKLDKTNVIVIVVCAIIVLACLAFVGYKSGWFTPKQKAKIEVDDYSEIEVLNSAVEVTDETVQQYITNILQSQSTSEEVTEGVVADGDQLNIDYVGKLAETGEVFDGGSAQGQSLTIGSGMMIDGFESGLIGAEIGKTKTINVTFPADYQNTDLAGKPATFDVTINSKTVTVVPELTDHFVNDYSLNYLDKELNTVEELEEYVHDYIYNYYLHTAMFEELQTKEHVTSYDEEQEAMLKQYSLDSLDYYAAMYGTTPDEYAVMYGYTDADTYTTEEAHYYLDTIMLVDKIIKDKKITWTDEQLDQSIAMYMARNGYSNQYTLEEFKTQSGETWLFLYENLEFKFDLAMEALEDNVVFVDEKTNAETTPAAEVPVESESASN